MRMWVHLTADGNPGRTTLVMDPIRIESRIWSTPEELERVLRILEAFPLQDGAEGYLVEADFNQRSIQVCHTNPTKNTGDAFLVLTFNEALRMNLQELNNVIGRAYKEELAFVK